MDPQHIEVKENPKRVFIGRDSWRKFMLGAAGTTMFVTLFFIANIVVYCIDFQPFYDVFKGYNKIWGFHALLAYGAFGASMAIPTILPSIGRAAAIPLFIVILICYLYIPALLVRVFWKPDIDEAEELILGYTVWSCVVVGFFINIVTTRKKINPTVGVAISIVLFVISAIVYVFVLKRLQPYVLTLFVLVGVVAGLSAYLNTDASFMLRKRNDFYLNSDWFLGFVHLHTDIFFRFWMDFFRKDVDYIDTDALNGKSVVLNNAIQRSRLTPISEELDDNSDVEDMDRTNVSGVIAAKSYM